MERKGREVRREKREEGGDCVMGMNGDTDVYSSDVVKWGEERG